MRWAHCIALRQEEARDFIESHFGEPHRRTLLIGGAGFDPRTLIYPKLMIKAAPGRLRLILIKEERPDPSDDLIELAAKNLEDLQSAEVETEVDVVPIDIFSEDLSVTGVRLAARRISTILHDDFTDVIVDQSALSIGVGFPLMRAVLTHEAVISRSVNVHAVVAAVPGLDNAVRSTPIDKPRDIIGFKGGLGLSKFDQAARLWLPQLNPGHGYELGLLHKAIVPHDTCPILPFPCGNPRAVDNLATEYSQAFGEWRVSDGNLIYAAEDNPLDLYRTILRIEGERSQVFERTGGSLVILSPSGSKAMALGALMAAVERDLPMMYIEALGYYVEWNAISHMPDDSVTLIHLWLAGEPYPDNQTDLLTVRT